MPRVMLLLNIGTKDAPGLGLDSGKTVAGAVFDADDKTAAEMFRRGWAIAVPSPAKIQAVPDVSLKADMTKPPKGQPT